MIIDKIENAQLYFGIHKGVKKALKYIQKTNFSVLEKGKHAIKGDSIFSIINEYKTKNIDTENLLESHVKYIDIQYVHEGNEKIGVTSLYNQKTVKTYDSKDDYMLFKEPFDLITLNQGMFAIFFPDDLHLPGIMVNGITKVKKVVIKVKK